MSDIDLRARSVEWANEPDPPPDGRDPQTIFERPTTGSPCYLWNSANETTEWLTFDGEPMEVRE